MDFLVFSDDWGRHPNTCEHLFRALLPEHRLVWVNTIGTRTPRLTLYDLRRTVEKLKAYGKASAPVDAGHPNLTVLSPPMLPFNQFAWCRARNRRETHKLVRRALDGLGFRDYVVLTSLPTTGDFFLDHPDQTKVYYCVDDFEGMPGVNPERIRSMEHELIAATDLHLYTARPLSRKFGPGAHYFPHGVDVDHFAGDDKAPLPREPRGPVIGFFGHVSEWIDIPLLKVLIESRRDWTFLFVGGHDVDVSPLREQENVIWTGPVPYSALPAYGRWFDVGLIPYRARDPRMETVNPVKLREYLALGLPVVSIPLPEIASLEGADVITAAGAPGFESAVARALAEDSPQRREARRLLAAEHSWKSRGETLLRLIQNCRT